MYDEKMCRKRARGRRNTIITLSPSSADHFSLDIPAQPILSPFVGRAPSKP
jgi:hypothetical protein